MPTQPPGSAPTPVSFPRFKDAAGVLAPELRRWLAQAPGRELAMHASRGWNLVHCATPGQAFPAEAVRAFLRAQRAPAWAEVFCATHGLQRCAWAFSRHGVTFSLARKDWACSARHTSLLVLAIHAQRSLNLPD